MDVFGVHQRLISDYDAFTSSLVGVRDREIQRHLDEERGRKARWPDPRISLNPNFRTGGTVAELVDEGVLHPGCRNYFRSKEHENDPGSRTLTLHRHQREAIEAAASGDSYVLTTGTGSGKSLAYIVPVVNDVLRRPNPDGISAIVVYPMNALANSQQHRYIRHDGQCCHVRRSPVEGRGRRHQPLRNHCPSGAGDRGDARTCHGPGSLPHCLQ